jgi:catechol 2,3-dioxygenase-like lactoylglutathione lyase family enzyme
VIWYRVRDLDAARAFYAEKLGFGVDELNADDGWVKLSRGKTVVVLAEGEPDPDDSLVAVIDVDDAKEEAERLRAADVDVGTVLELHEEVRLVDLFDPDGNRLQLIEEVKK